MFPLLSKEKGEGARMSAAERSLELPVAVIGGGPVGLAAAAQLVTRRIPVRLYEAGDAVAAHVRSWGHVRLFSPWRYNTEEASTELLRAHGWQEPPGDVLPTGHDLYAAYLQPLAQTPALRNVIETRARVHTISRRGIDKVVGHGRAHVPFMLAIDSAEGPRIDLAWAVIDASGTWATPNPLAASGTQAIGENDFADRIAYGIPDVLGADRAVYRGKRVLVIGGGHSAANALIDLAKLAENDPRMLVAWAVRSTNLTRVFGGGAADQLPARGALGADLKRLVANGRLDIILGFAAEAVVEQGARLAVRGHTESGLREIGATDRIIVATGQRPNLSITRELRLDLDPWLESARTLGPMIDPNLHSCGSVPPHGYKELAHPEPGYFSVGIKSYGRAPTFLMATGYEQARSVVAYLAGDMVAANDVRLVLPETGVCSTDLAPSGNEPSACCGSPAPQVSNMCCAEDAKSRPRSLEIES
jgi:thioredoxin reductase